MHLECLKISHGTAQLLPNALSADAPRTTAPDANALFSNSSSWINPLQRLCQYPTCHDRGQQKKSPWQKEPLAKHSLGETPPLTPPPHLPANYPHPETVFTGLNDFGASVWWQVLVKNHVIDRKKLKWRWGSCCKFSLLYFMYIY